jgi:hypothetical protein
LFGFAPILLGAMLFLIKKTIMKAFILSLLALLLLIQPVAHSANKNRRQAAQTRTILVVGFAGNVNSNYFPRETVAEKIEVDPGMFDSVLHDKLVNGFTNLDKGNNSFIILQNLNETNRIRGYFSFNGENEEIYPEINRTYSPELKKIMEHHGAHYVMVFGQYYLKWQEEPFNTLFHIFNYSVFGPNMEEVTRGKEYFNTFGDFGSRDIDRQLARLIRRNASLIARTIQ